jgi:hypothetical protein
MLTLLLAMWCGTSPANDAQLRAMHARVKSQAATTVRTIELHDGTFVVPNDPAIAPGARHFDLDGQSLVFTPAGGSSFTARRVALQYREPASSPLRDFAAVPEHFVARDLPFAFPIHGRSVPRIYVSAFNGITFEEPVAETAMQFDVIEATVHRAAIVSPLLLTSRKPASLAKPRVYVDEREGAVTITWRSAGGVFSYDVQAELASSGTITFSYRGVATPFGAPIITPGFDPATAPRTIVFTQNDGAGVTTEVPQPIRPMTDIRKLEVSTFDDAEVMSIRLTVDAPIDRALLAEDQRFGFLFAIDESVAAVELTRDEVRVQSFSDPQYTLGGAAAYVNGNVIEIFAKRERGTQLVNNFSIAAVSYMPPYAFFVDGAGDRVNVSAPKRNVATDFSTLTEKQLSGVITEPFLLGAFDPLAVWAALQQQYGLSDDEFDGVAMYQDFYTDLIFYASAYATSGNPQVDGISYEDLPLYGTGVAKRPTLMHMNHLTYDFSATEKSASQVMLHEFGHRWLYYLEVELPPEEDRVLNPVSPHPAAYVHTPSAFAMHGANEASVMGGGFFTPLGGNQWKTTAANYGYSWLDLYAMGLAAPAEVRPWFFLKGTTLPQQYFPPNDVAVSGTRRDVDLDHVRRQLGFREPSTAYADRAFRVLFVLVTNDGASAEELATMRRWRSVFERDFAKATGNRGSVKTSFVRGVRSRAMAR